MPAMVRIKELDGAYYWLDSVLYVNSDHPEADALEANSILPAINQAAFNRLKELTETNRLLRAENRECADAYQRGYTQGVADAAVGKAEKTTDWQPRG